VKFLSLASILRHTRPVLSDPNSSPFHNLSWTFEVFIMDPHAALELLEYLRTCYPIFLLILFVAAFVANTTVTAKRANKHASESLGPGGRPLPQRSRAVPAYHKPQEFSRNVKRTFNLLSVGILLTFIADATIYITHVMVARAENWWRGQSVVVCSLGSFFSLVDS
jgi:hypothetical protein